MTHLRIQSLSKSFTKGQQVVNNVSFNLNQGEIICLLGPSGCGKTTLLRLIAGLEVPDSGDVLRTGVSLLKVPPHQRDFGMMFQDFALFPHKNVFDNIAFGLQMRGDSAAQIKARVTEMLTLVDLQGFAKRDIGQLSGGEQQRVALARALAPGPQLLMLDEPLGSLDRSLRERLMLELRTILKQVGVTALTVTHDQTEAFALADRIAVMNLGRIEQLGTPEDIYRWPANPFVAQFLGFQNLLTGLVQASGTVKTSLGELNLPTQPSRPDEVVTLLIKPDAAIFAPSPSDGHPNYFRLDVVLSTISFRGRYTQIWVEAGETQLMFEVSEKPPWSPTDQIQLWLNLDRILIWQ